MIEWKETDYGKIPSKWKFVRGIDFCSKVTDGTHDSPKQVNFGRFLVTSKHIKGRDIDFDNAYKISEEDYKKIIARSHVDQWDVIISMIGEYCGFTYIERNHLPEYAVKNVGMFKTGNEDKAKWLHYYFNSKIGKAVLEAQKTGTSQPYITLGSLRDIEILVPDDERNIKAIAEVLSSLDDKIDLLQRQNKTLEEMAETLFRQWFVEEAEEKWKEIRLGQFITPKKGKNITKSEAIDGLYPVVAGGLEPSCFHNQSNTKAPVITISASGANAGFVKLYYNEVWSSDSSFIDETVTDHIYFFYVLLKLKQSQIFDKQEGSAQPHIYPSHIMNLEAYNYPISLIDKFNQTVNSFFNKISKNIKQIQQLEALRDTLLPKLMSGAINVN